MKRLRNQCIDETLQGAPYNVFVIQCHCHTWTNHGNSVVADTLNRWILNDAFWPKITVDGQQYLNRRFSLFDLLRVPSIILWYKECFKSVNELRCEGALEPRSMLVPGNMEIQIMCFVTSCKAQAAYLYVANSIFGSSVFCAEYWWWQLLNRSFACCH